MSQTQEEILLIGAFGLLWFGKPVDDVSQTGIRSSKELHST